MRIAASLNGADQVREQLARIPGLTRKVLDASAVEIEDYVHAEATKHQRPGGTGALVRSITKRRIADGKSQGWEIFHDLQHAPHAVFVHWGTRPHEIRPKLAGVYTSYKDIEGKTVRKGIPKGGRGRTTLRWAAGGKFAFAKVVHHPGNQPDTWMVRAAAKAPAIFQAHVQRLLATNSGA